MQGAADAWHGDGKWFGRMKAGPEKDILYVKTFGGFSLIYQGRAITSGMNKESQFICLMQLLLHERAEGVGRDRLEEALFAERDIEDIRHALRSVIYNAKKKLKKAGLPEENYIVQKEGVYYWTDRVPVEEDAERFEQLYGEAVKEQQPERRLKLYLDACFCYQGEFLPSYAGELWAAQEARRYREMFCACMNEAVRLLRERQDYQRMEELGIHAARISPLADWEVVTMEALVSQERYEEARRLYDDTVDLYFQEQGVKPSPRMMSLFQRLGAQIEHGHGALDDIQKKLSESDCGGLGGYLCPYPVFQGIYRMVERMMERGGQSVYLMLCRVVDKNGRLIRDREIREDLTERLGDAVLHSVRHSDAVSRYGSGQYLVLLINTTLENCSIIQKRINDRFLEGWQRTEIQYYVNSVFGVPGRKGTILSKEG